MIKLDNMGRSQLRAAHRERPEDRAQGMEDSALNTVGGYAGLSSISRHYVSAAGLERNSALLQDYYLKRQLIRQLQGLADRASVPPTSLTTSRTKPVKACWS